MAQISTVLWSLVVLSYLLNISQVSSLPKTNNAVNTKDIKLKTTMRAIKETKDLTTAHPMDGTPHNHGKHKIVSVKSFRSREEILREQHEEEKKRIEEQKRVEAEKKNKIPMTTLRMGTQTKPVLVTNKKPTKNK